jgi:hypothetical protein
MNIITIDNFKYIIEKDAEETIQSFNLRTKFVLNKKPKTKKELDLLISESYIKYNELYMKCKYL